MQLKGRIDRALRELRRRESAQDVALSQANQIVEFLVAFDLVHKEVGEERPKDDKAFLDYVIVLWRKHAGELGVPNDGTAERRIIGLCRAFRESENTHESGNKAGLIDRLRGANDP